MGLLDGALQSLGLAPDYSAAQSAAQFNPVGVQGLFGNVNWNPDARSFSSQLDPRMNQQVNSIFSQLGSLDPASEYQMMRDMAAPGMEQERLGMENRLFSQGLMGASQPYGEGGAMRSLLDSQQLRDMMMQQQSIQSARAERVNLLNQLLGIQGMENSMFGIAGNMSGLAQNAGNMQSQIAMQQANFLPNALWSLGGNAVSGYTMGAGMGAGGGVG